MSYTLPSGIVKAVAGIVESAETEPYVTAIKQAESVIGKNFADTEKAQENRQNLVNIVKLNLINRKKYERESLNRKYGMMISHHTLCNEKKKFCYELAKKLNLI